MVAAATKGADGYLIEIAGCASSTGTKQLNQKLSEERAAAVANYLLQKKEIFP
jgi:outer membrane protein OmpA-like peptidoglycan-associated protein